MKKLFLLLVAVLGLVGLTACGNNNNQQQNSETYDFTMWVSDTKGVKELTEKQIQAFAAQEGITLNATLSAVGEGDAATQMLGDLETGADLYCFAQDQLARLVSAGALTPLGVKASETIKANNDEISVAAASVSGQLYCYPLTSDNCYFLYYDKRVLSETDVLSLETIIEKCEAAGKKVSFNLGSGFFNASFFFATGCESNWYTDNEGKITSVEDTFNSANGLIALKGMQKLVKSSCYEDSGDATDFEAATPSAAVVTGTWNSSVTRKILGENMGVAKLPSFTVDGNSYQLTSFMGCKLLGLKPQTDAKKAAVLQKLALYLTSEAAQLERHAQFGWGPSNLAAQANDSVKNDPVIAAVEAQKEDSVIQRAIHGSWWDIAATCTAAAKAAALNDAVALQAALDSYKTAIDAIFTMSDEVKNAWTVIGVVKGTNWDTDFPMTEENGVWTSKEAFEFAAGTEFKVRKGLSWDESFGNGSANFVVETAGVYYVKFTVATSTVELVPAE